MIRPDWPKLAGDWDFVITAKSLPALHYMYNVNFILFSVPLG